ncbi:achromobactin-binding protein [Pseudomonas syringae pv. spinaceae]|uniref:Achromobactin-binding protein n=1 Tax=Pseudomonas syringae pv. spinaceae TaxID=264459 RepID=A0A0P9ZX27_PSESX|nr:achromobactin-binding protein [Pseudomonas syringae pv. spinaceae]
MVDPGQPAIGAIIGFPEARRLPRHFGRLIVAGAEQGGFDRVAEIGIEPRQQRQWQRRDQIIGAHHLFATAVAVVIGHGYAVFKLTNPAHLRAQLHLLGETLVEGVGDAVHAAYRLKHGGRKLREFSVQQGPPQLGVQQPVERDRLRAGRQCSWVRERLLMTGTQAALIGQFLRQVAIHLQKRQQALTLFTAQHIVQGIALHRRGQ